MAADVASAADLGTSGDHGEPPHAGVLADLIGLTVCQGMDEGGRNQLFLPMKRLFDMTIACGLPLVFSKARHI